MKPIRIIIKGINSYVSEQVVHFDKVAESKLFGIFGETGSGKTTILDCIVMALYGTSERDTIQNVINVNTNEAYIIYDFEIYFEGENRKFRIERRHKLLKSGIVKSDATLTDLDTNDVLAEKPDDVNNAVARIIGIGKKEFLKCIAIPQGEFDAFLTDTPMNRKKTISKLFNLENFGVNLQEKLKNRKNLYSNKKISTEEKLAIYNNINDLNLSALEMELLEKEKNKIDVEFQLNVEKTNNIMLINDYDNILKLNAANDEINKLLETKPEIDFGKKQIEYTNQYGNYISVNDKYEGIVAEISAKNSDIISIRTELESTDNTISAEKKHREELASTKKKLDDKKIFMLSKMTDVKLLNDQASALEKQINSYVDTCNSYDATIEDNSKLIRKIKTDNQNIYIELDELNQDYKRCNNVLEKLNNAITIDVRRDIVGQLNNIEHSYSRDIDTKISDTYSKSIITSILNAIKTVRQEQEIAIANITNELDIEFRNENISIIKHNLEDEKDRVMQNIIALNNKLQDNAKDMANYTTIINETKKLKEEIVKQYNLDLKQFEKLQNQLKSLPSEADIAEISNKIKQIDHDILMQDENINGINNLRTKLFTTIEVKSAEIDNLNKSAKELKDVLALFDLKKYEQDIKNNRNLLLTNQDEINAIQDKINTFDTNMAYYYTLVQELDASIRNKNVTKEIIEESENKINQTQAQLNQILSDIGALNNNIKIQQDNLHMVKALKLEYKQIMKELNTIQKLQELIANGALMEFIAEEYMYLITDFANKYVYSISKGKYLLKYDKDFYVLDNFNGGISRTIKTLSGGERFIISLSLALGITQSIATNNNKDFSFFFIDEGFGSLSESYIDKVLQSFDTLINMNFTVGFITHVEKMKNYITNKVIVKKDNNDQGSIITEEY